MIFEEPAHLRTSTVTGEPTVSPTFVLGQLECPSTGRMLYPKVFPSAFGKVLQQSIYEYPGEYEKGIIPFIPD